MHHQRPTAIPPAKKYNGANKNDDLSYLDDLLEGDDLNMKDDQSSGSEDQEDVEENVIGVKKAAESFGIMNASFKFGQDFNNVKKKKSSHNGTITV